MTSHDPQLQQRRSTKTLIGLPFKHVIGKINNPEVHMLVLEQTRHHVYPNSLTITRAFITYPKPYTCSAMTYTPYPGLSMIH